MRPGQRAHSQCQALTCILCLLDANIQWLYWLQQTAAGLKLIWKVTNISANIKQFRCLEFKATRSHIQKMYACKNSIWSNTTVRTMVYCQRGPPKDPDKMLIPPLLMFQSVSIFVLHTTPQFTKLYKWVPVYRCSWKCEWIVFARNCCVARMLTREVELMSQWTGLPGKEKCKALWAVQWTGWILH